MTSKIMATYTDEHSSSSCVTGVRVKAQYCHLEVNQVLALEYLHVVLRVLFILNIAVIANTGISSHTKLTRLSIIVALNITVFVNTVISRHPYYIHIPLHGSRHHVLFHR